MPPKTREASGGRFVGSALASPILLEGQWMFVNWFVQYLQHIFKWLSGEQGWISWQSQRLGNALNFFQQLWGKHTLGPGLRGQMACHVASSPHWKGLLETGCTSLLNHTHTELITCYLLNLFILYQPVTCCLNTSSSRGCQGFLSGRRNQISIVSIFNLLSAFPTTVTTLGVKQAWWSLFRGVGETPAAGCPPRGHSKACGP